MWKSLREKAKKAYYDSIQKYQILGKIGEGAYGVVKKAVDKNQKVNVAIKQFKTRITRDGEGIPLTVCREINLLRELSHENVVKVREIILDSRDSGEKPSVIMIFEYCELDLEKIIKHHKAKNQKMDMMVIKSITWQILRGLHYLHQNWVIHRDMKPANVLMKDNGSERGVAKIADFGLARFFKDPIRCLGDDGPVVTIWYRAPEVLLGAKHYTPAVDIWAVGCILAEMIILKPIFEGKEVKQDGVQNPFQKNQIETIFNILGTPTDQNWKDIKNLPEYQQIKGFKNCVCNLAEECKLNSNSKEYDFLSKLLEFDPKKRITAEQALKHPFFQENPLPSGHAFYELKPNFYKDAEHKVTSEKQQQPQPARPNFYPNFQIQPNPNMPSIQSLQNMQNLSATGLNTALGTLNPLTNVFQANQPQQFLSFPTNLPNVPNVPLQVAGVPIVAQQNLPQLFSQEQPQSQNIQASSLNNSRFYASQNPQNAQSQQHQSSGILMHSLNGNSTISAPQTVNNANSVNSAAILHSSNNAVQSNVASSSSIPVPANTLGLSNLSTGGTGSLNINFNLNGTTQASSTLNLNPSSLLLSNLGNAAANPSTSLTLDGGNIANMNVNVNNIKKRNGGSGKTVTKLGNGTVISQLKINLDAKPANASTATSSLAPNGLNNNNTTGLKRSHIEAFGETDPTRNVKKR